MPGAKLSSTRESALHYGGAILAAAAVLYSHWDSRRHFFPGQWPGDQGMFFPVALSGAAMAGAFLLAAVIALSLRRRFGLLTMLLALSILPCFTRWPMTDPSFRLNAEMADYKRAIASDRSFGDQHEEEINGRKLTYWRWMSWGIDNAVGVVFDPSDKLSIDEDLKAFRELTGGVIARIERLEPNWFFVTHT